MAFKPYESINNIYKSKEQWNIANNNKDENKKNEIAKKAQQYYAQLRSNGYGDVADQLAGSNYEQAKGINDYYAKVNRNPTRPYLYTAGKKYGMSQADVDSLIGYDNDTGEISFGGKKIGKPNTVVDGVSYWDDASVLDNALSDYVSRSGYTTSNGVKDNLAYSQRMQAAENKNDSMYSGITKDKEDIYNMYKDIFGYANSDVTKTDEYKSTFDRVMAKYDLNALQGRDNAAASGAASNGGNIDSFAATNALRQQAALTAQGAELAHKMGIEAYNARLESARAILSDLGIYNTGAYNQMNTAVQNDSALAQQYFENGETYKNNELSRNIAISELTGNVHPTLGNIYNPYFNENGELKNDNIDYQSIVDAATEKLKNATSASEKANLEATIKYANQARNYKIANNPALSKYADSMTLVAPDETADFKLSKEQLASNERINDKNNQHELNLLDKSGEWDIKKNQAKSSASNPQILAWNHNQSSSGGNSSIINSPSNNKSSQSDVRTDSKGTYVGDVKVGDKNGKPLLTTSQAQKELENGNLSPQVKYCLEYYGLSTEKKNNPTVADKDIKEIVDMLNEDIANRYGDEYTALTKDSIDTYKLGDVDVDYVIKKVLGADKYTDEQKKYILQNKFGITDNQINNVLRDNHY